MDIDINAQDTGQWKKKYFDHLEESERREKQWQDAEDLLRKTISRLTLAADGLDDTLDRQLRDLRNAIRDRASTAQLRSRIDDMSSTLVRLDQKRKQKAQGASLDPLLELLEALSLPRGTGRQTKALKKQLAQHSAQDDQGAIQAFAGLIHAAIDLSAEENRTSPATDSAPRGGLLQRLFGAEDKSPETDSAKPHSAMASPASGESVREILIQLLERLSLPDELLEQVALIRDRIEKLREGESWDRVIEQIAELIQAIRRQTQKEKQGIEDFLVQLTERLQQVNQQLQGSAETFDESLRAGEQLDSVVKEGISGIETSVRDATDLDQLKQVVQRHIESVLTHMEKHRQEEQQRHEQARSRMAEMSQRLEAMEGESEQLRSRVQQERNQAMTDALTGIPNRLAYEQRLEQEIARWKRFATPLVLVVWDVDLFKTVNDTFGHRAGDKVLRTIARVLADGVRETDFVARYGGEEFVQIMTGSALEDCLPVVDKLRASIEATGFHFREKAVTITASCGLAGFREGEAGEQCFERADKALYRAKQAGRNRCEVAE